MPLHTLPTLRDLIEVLREEAIEALGGVTRASMMVEVNARCARAVKDYLKAKGRIIEAERDRDRALLERDDLARTNAELQAALAQQLERPTLPLSTAFLHQVIGILEGHDYPDAARTLRDALEKGGA